MSELIERTDHPWVGKPCGIERVDDDADRLAGEITAVCELDGELECVVVDTDDGLFVTAADRVEVLA